MNLHRLGVAAAVPLVASAVNAAVAAAGETVAADSGAEDPAGDPVDGYYEKRDFGSETPEGLEVDRFAVDS